jgi:hypothetical protein
MTALPGKGTDAEQSTLVELLRLQHGAMAAGGPLRGTSEAPGVTGHGGGGETVVTPRATGDGSPQVAYYPANYPMTQFPAGMGYVAAPVAHPGANLPRSSPCCCGRSVHPKRPRSVHGTQADRAPSGVAGYAVQPNRGVKRQQHPTEYSPRLSPYAGMPPSAAMYQVVPLSSLMAAGGAYSLMAAPQHGYHQMPLAYMETHADAWAASMLRAPASVSLGRWAHVCGTPSVAPLEPALVYQLLCDASFRPGARPTTFSRDKATTWIFKEGKQYVSHQSCTAAASSPLPARSFCGPDHGASCCLRTRAARARESRSREAV